MEKVTAILLGAGQRGEAYAKYALEFPEEFEIVAFAEPEENRRKEFAELHKIKEKNSYVDWEELLSQGKIADAALICTQDRMHYEPTMEAIKLGYHILLEKPMSNDPAECVKMARYATEQNRIMTVCHVLRYTPFYETIKKIIDSGKIGHVVSLHQDEDVACWHQSHSFVRGNWRNTKESTPMILQKSCHDMDIIYWLVGSECKKVSSFGSLMHFTKENAPKGAPERCLDGCPYRDECQYYAPDIYINCEDSYTASIIRKVVSVDTSTQALTNALKTGPYGRCVYHCDNNVVDHQVVNMEFDSGATASFSMCAFTYDEGRKLTVMGTKGQIKGWCDDNKIEVTTFLHGDKETIELNSSNVGHGGGDFVMMKEFVRQLATNGEFKGRSSGEESLWGHIMAAAAEKSRVEGTVVELLEYEKELIQ